MTYYFVRLDKKEIFDESIEKPSPTKILEHKASLNSDIMIIEGKVVINTADSGDSPDLKPSNTIRIRATQRIALAQVVGHDKSCPGQKPPGKPILEPPKEGRVVVKIGEVVEVDAQSAYSCHDDPTTPEIMATGNKPFYVVAEGQPGAGQFCRQDKTEIVSS
jgi:hypothetical protein